MDRLTSLTVFGKVVECGGFSAAARRLDMSVTMVATHVRSLEERIGVRLLNRTTRKVSLTETGRFYYNRSTQILADLDEADLQAGALSTSPRGILKLYSTTAVVRFLLPVVDEFLQLYPAVTLDMNVNERMVDMIEDGYDLAIRTVPSPNSSLIVRNLAPWRHVLVCAPSYLDGHDAPETPADLAGHNCLQYEFYPFGDEFAFESPDGERIDVKIQGSVMSNSVDTLRFLAQAGRALWFAPIFSVAEDIETGRLIRLMPDYRGVELTVNALYPDRNHMPTKVRLFLELLSKRFAEHRRWSA